MDLPLVSLSGDLDGEAPGGELVFLDVLGEVEYGNAARVVDECRSEASLLAPPIR